MLVSKSSWEIDQTTFIPKVTLEMIVTAEQLADFRFVESKFGASELEQILGNRFLEILKEHKLL